jgi:transcription elongation factor GreA
MEWMEQMAETSYLTSDGRDKLQEELTQLKGPAREDLSRRLREAIQMGDLSENADYIQAKEEQGFLEGRIQELEQILNNVVIIDNKEKPKDTVDIGSTITVQEAEFPEEIYFLVGPKEADPLNGRISYESPIGKAMLGHRSGDKVKIETPGGSIHLTIKKIS